MSYDKFKKLVDAHRNLYNIEMKHGGTGIRGASVRKVYEFVKLVGEDKVDIYIY